MRDYEALYWEAQTHINDLYEDLQNDAWLVDLDYVLFGDDDD